MININALFYGILMDVINHLSPDSILQIRESVFGGPYAMNQYFYIRHD